MQGIAAHPTSLTPRDTRAGHRAAGPHAIAVALAAALVLAFTMSPAEAATIYKSVDDRGNVQFSQTPPKDRPSETVEAGSSAPAPSASTNEGNDEETPTVDGDRASDPATEVKVVDREKAREACRQAREQREAVANSGNQLMVQDEAGKYQPMSEAQRTERLERLDAIIDEACRAAEE